MDVRNYVGFSKIVHASLWEYILKHNIPVNHRADEHMASIELYSSDPHWPWIETYLKQIGKKWSSDTIFTIEELEQADWMRVRSIWQTGYPMPMDGFKYETITYTRERYCEQCGIGLEQTESFRIKKAPSWGRRNFFSLFWVWDELFVSEAVKLAFQTAGITGISFMPVKNSRGEKEFEGIFQLRIQNTLAEGLVDNPRNLQAVAICEKCGRKKSLDNKGIMLQFKKHIFENASDIVKTGDYFGVVGNKSPAREIIISQKVYRTIVENKLDKNLMFYPIELV